MTDATTLPSAAETQELRRAFRILYECATPEEKTLIQTRLQDPDFKMVGGAVTEYLLKDDPSIDLREVDIHDGCPLCVIDDTHDGVCRDFTSDDVVFAGVCLIGLLIPDDQLFRYCQYSLLQTSDWHTWLSQSCLAERVLPWELERVGVSSREELLSKLEMEDGDWYRLPNNVRSAVQNVKCMDRCGVNQNTFFSVWDAFVDAFSAATGKAVLLDELTTILQG